MYDPKDVFTEDGYQEYMAHLKILRMEYFLLKITWMICISGH
jgi:hypothetical protein